jgi:hypothetical protein
LGVGSTFTVQWRLGNTPRPHMIEPEVLA